MRWVLERVSDPEIEPITAEEFVRNVGEFQSAATERAEDIEMLITAAREWSEKLTGRALIDQAWRLTLSDAAGGHVLDPVQEPPAGYATGIERGPGSSILLRRSPVIEITSFVSVDAAGEETELDAGTYELREGGSKWPRVVALNGVSWGQGTYRITFRAGYADRVTSPPEDASKVPARFRRAILLHAEAFYDRDERSMKTLLEVAEQLIDPERCGLGLA